MHAGLIKDFICKCLCIVNRAETCSKFSGLKLFWVFLGARAWVSKLGKNFRAYQALKILQATLEPSTSYFNLTPVKPDKKLSGFAKI